MGTVTSDSFCGLVIQALERMAFVLAEPIELTPGEVLASCVAHAAIDLDGETPYRLCVAATPGMVREIAAGMMGIDAEEIDVDEHAAATVAELANVLGGELIMLLTSGVAAASLGLPSPVDGDAVGAVLDDPADGFAFVLGGDAGQLLVCARRR
jgi:CheY-specific phosphatase CheX